MATANYYSVFALEPTATDIDIKRRYRQLSFQYHPDHGGSVEKMMAINEAYGVLSNGLLRREYDRRYAAAQRPPVATTYADYHQQEYYSQPTTPRQRHEHSKQPIWQSYFWTVLAILGAIIFGFIAFGLYRVVQVPANTGGDIPGVVNQHTHPIVSQKRGYYGYD